LANGSAIPTNIITGFLGSGKTSAILQLLKNKPEGERWAVLVNEFGEIGVDGSLVQGQHPESAGIFVREVPGGCMCCAAGLPMQVALNQLIRKARPDRLLIEPTGLGHPREILQTLSSEHYRSVLSLQKTVTLVDARKLSDPRYTTHQTFNQQIAIADVIVGNKQDLYQTGDQTALEAYAGEAVDVIFTEQGHISPELLLGPTAHLDEGTHSHPVGDSVTAEKTLVPSGEYVRAVNEGEGFRSIGWRFSPDQVFDRDKLFDFLSGVSAERLKGVFITGQGCFGYNLTSDALTEVPLDDCFESRIEIVAEEIDEEWEIGIMQARLVRS
jgi:G3E family GTPase